MTAEGDSVSKLLVSESHSVPTMLL